MSYTRGWNAQDDADLIHLAASGFQTESIAWALNRSPHTIRARLNELGWASAARVADEGDAVPAEVAAESEPLPAQVGPRRFLGF